MKSNTFTVLSYRYRLLPTKKQHAALNHILEQQRILYNAALEERIDCYRKTGRSIHLNDQNKSLTIWRQSDPEARSLPVRFQRWTLKRLDDSFKLFFGGITRKDGTDYPRFRGKHRWRSFGSAEMDCIQIHNCRVRFRTLPGSLRFRRHRPIPSDADIRSCVFTKDDKGWVLTLQARTPIRPLERGLNSIGVDLGLIHLASLSDGTHIENPKHSKQITHEVKRQQRALDRCRKNSKRRYKVKRLLSRIHRKSRNSRETHLHQISANLTSNYDMIAIEKININNIARGFLGKEIRGASWGKFRQMLAYKTARAGRELVEVDPRNTSQACSGCGVIVKKDLSVRVHDCPECGLVLDRDHNAAINILHKAVAGLGLHNVAGYGERATGNITCEDVTCETLPRIAVGYDDGHNPIEDEMSRSVTEWVGRTDDSNPSDACKRRIVDRQQGKCALSGIEFRPGDKIEYDHITPLWLGGENRENNLQAVLSESHKRKTATEAAIRSKVNSIRSKHLGIKKKSSNPVPGGKASKWKRKMDGTVVRRD